MGFFDSFVKRVMNAVKAGKLPAQDVATLDRMFEKARARNKILARGILSALSAGKSSEEEIKKLGKLLEKASERAGENKNPFSTSDEKELREIFDKAGLPQKTSRWLYLHMDQFLNNQINEELNQKNIVPSKKIVKFEEQKQKLRG